MDCRYWEELVGKLLQPSESNWAAHVLSDVENVKRALKCVSGEIIIENTIAAYDLIENQPYCDEILFNFDKERVIEIFEQHANHGENIKRFIRRFLEL